METGTRHEGEGDAQQPADRARRSTCCKTMRWTDNSMGSNFDYGWSDINQAFAAGNVGMYISGSDVYTNLVQASNIDPSIYGLATDPAREEQDRRRPRRRHARRRAAGRERRPSAPRPSSGSTSSTSSRSINEGAGDPQREDARRVQAAGRRARAAGLQQGAVRPRQHLDQAVHQRAADADEAVHDGHLQPEADPGAGGLDPERLPLARRGGAGGADRPEREHPAAARRRRTAPRSARSAQGK